MFETRRVQDIDFYPFTHEDINAVFVRTIIAENQNAGTKSFLPDDVDISYLKDRLEDVLDGLEEYTTADREEPGSPGTVNTGAYTRHLPKQCDNPDDEVRIPAERILDFLLGVAVMIKERCFFLTANNLIGIGPLDSEPHDVIALIAGAETPFVLRPVGDEGSGEEGE